MQRLYGPPMVINNSTASDAPLALGLGLGLAPRRARPRALSVCLGRQTLALGQARKPLKSSLVVPLAGRREAKNGRILAAAVVIFASCECRLLKMTLYIKNVIIFNIL